MRDALRRHRWVVIIVGLVLVAAGVLFASAGAWAVRVPAECSNPALNWQCHYDTITNNQVWAPGKKHVVIGKLIIANNGSVTVTTDAVYIKKSLEGPNWNLHWESGGIKLQGNGRLIAQSGTTWRSLEDEAAIPSPTTPWQHRWLGITVEDGAFVQLQNSSIWGALNGLAISKQNSSQIIGGEIAYSGSDNDGSNDQSEGYGIVLTVGGHWRSGSPKYTAVTIRNVTIHDHQRSGIFITTTAWDNTAGLESEISSNVIRDNGEDGISITAGSTQNFRYASSSISTNDISGNRHGIFVADTQAAYWTGAITIDGNTIHNNDQLAMQLHPAVIVGANTFTANGPSGTSVIRLLAATINQEPTVAKSFRWSSAGSGSDPVVYQLAGTVQVQSQGGAALHSLTIDPGVVVKVNGNGQIIGNRGKIVIAGSAASPVLLTSITDTSAEAGGDTRWAEPALNENQPWLGVWLADQADYAATFSSLIDYATIRLGATGIKITNGLFIPNDHTVTHSTIERSISHGITIETDAASVISRPVIGGVGAGNTIRNNGGVGVYLSAPAGVVGGTIDADIIGNTIEQNGQDGIFGINGSGTSTASNILINLQDTIISGNNGRGIALSNATTNPANVRLTGQGNTISNNVGSGVSLNRTQTSLTDGTIANNLGPYEVENITGGTTYTVGATNTFWGDNFGPYDTSAAGAEPINTCRVNAAAAITDPVATGTEQIQYTPWTGLVVPPPPVVTSIDGQPLVPTPLVSVSPTITLASVPTAIDATDWQVRLKTTQVVVWEQTGSYCDQLFSRQVATPLVENTVYQVRAGYRNRLAGTPVWSTWYDFQTSGSEPATILTINGQPAIANTWPPDQYPPSGVVVPWDAFPTIDTNPLEFVGSVTGQPSNWFFAEFDSWNPSQPDAGRVSEWVDSSSTEHLRPYGDPDQGRFINQNHWYLVRYTAAGQPESPYYFFSFSATPPPWLTTSRGDIYARGPIAIDQGVPAGAANALYCVFTSSGSATFVPANDPLFGECTVGPGSTTLAPLVFPRRESNYFSGTFGQLQIDQAIAAATVDCSLPDGSLAGTIRFCDTAQPLVIAGATLTNSLSGSGAGTLIVRGDVRITGDITYEAFTGTQLDRMASLGIMALKRADGTGGNILFDGSVATAVGAYYAEGQIDTCASGNCAAVPLTVRGLMAAGQFHFGRTFADGVTPAEDITYDGRALINVPPGMENFVKGLPQWR